MATRTQELWERHLHGEPLSQEAWGELIAAGYPVPTEEDEEEGDGE